MWDVSFGRALDLLGWLGPLLTLVHLRCAVVPRAAGVFDGHGPHGRCAAKYASTQLPALLAASPALASRGGDKKRLRAMREACCSVDAAMQNPAACGFDASLSGTTACFAVVCGRKVYLANAGAAGCQGRLRWRCRGHQRSI